MLEILSNYNFYDSSARLRVRKTRRRSLVPARNFEPCSKRRRKDRDPERDSPTRRL